MLHWVTPTKGFRQHITLMEVQWSNHLIHPQQCPAQVKHFQQMKVLDDWTCMQPRIYKFQCACNRNKTSLPGSIDEKMKCTILYQWQYEMHICCTGLWLFYITKDGMYCMRLEIWHTQLTNHSTEESMTSYEHRSLILLV